MAPAGYRSVSLTDGAADALKCLQALVTGLAGQPLTRSEAIQVAALMLAGQRPGQLGREVRETVRALGLDA